MDLDKRLTARMRKRDDLKEEVDDNEVNLIEKLNKNLDQDSDDQLFPEVEREPAPAPKRGRGRPTKYKKQLHFQFQFQRFLSQNIEETCAVTRKSSKLKGNKNKRRKNNKNN